MLELRAREKKLKAEQQERLQRAARKAAADKLAAERQRARLQAEEEQKRQFRLQEQARQDELRVQREADAERNLGVVCQAQLRAVPLEDGGSARGVRRSADKVLLPPSIGQQLLEQESHVAGTPFFEIRTASGACTHASVLEYTAAEGTVAVPPKVWRSLWGPDATGAACTMVQVKFKRLEKGTYVSFQPRKAAFHKEVADDVSGVLETALFKHSALTVGDWISIEHAGVQHDLKVLQLQPADCVSVIDTEMEADVEPSLEHQERLLAEEVAARKRLELLAAIHAEEERMAAEVVAAAQQRAAQLEALKQEKLAVLPEEPPASDASAVVTMLRFPDGSRVSRRFRRDDLLRSLFDFTESQGAGGRLPGQYQLVAQMPRRIFNPASCGHDVTLQAAGLTSKEMLLLEPLS